MRPLILLAVAGALVSSQSAARDGAGAVLRGTVVAAPQERSFAILEIGGVSTLVRFGATIPTLGELVSVEPKRVIVRSGAALRELLLGSGASSGPVTLAAPLPAAAPAAVPTDSGPAPETPPERQHLNSNTDRTPYPLVP